MVVRDLLVAAVLVVTGSLDFGESLGSGGLDLPGSKGVALVEDLVDLFEGAALGLGVHEQDVDEAGGVEGGEQEVGLVRLRVK